MKKHILSLAFIGLFTSAYADYSAHQFHYMDMKLSKCKEIASVSAKKIGFKNITEHNGANYAIVQGMNSEGYSFQYTCVAQKSFAYLIINGAYPNKRNALRDKLGNEIKSKAKNIKK